MEPAANGIQKKYDRIVGADDFAQPLATKELYGCGIPLAGTVRPAVGKDGFAEVCGEILVR